MKPPANGLWARSDRIHKNVYFFGENVWYNKAMKTTYVLPRAMIKDLVRLAICYGKTKRGAWIWVHENYTQSKRAIIEHISSV